MTRPIFATVDPRAVLHNIDVLRARAPGARLLAVAKANAYGHGLSRLADALSTADGVGVLDLDEAVVLRDRGHRHPIVLLEGFFDATGLRTCATHDLTPMIHTTEQLALLQSARLQKPIAVWLKFNSGMNRLGFRADPLRDAFAMLKAHPAVASVTLATHFADADTADGVAVPLASFRTAIAGLDAPVSLANSAATLRFAQTHGDWIRPGIAIYGATPFADAPAATFGLRPAMTLRSRVIATQTLAAGESVGYGSSFVAPGPMRIGVVACGYGDGYPRHAPTGTPVIVAGVRTRIVGRVSMDMLCVDLEPVPGAAVGSPVELWGTNLPVDDVALPAGTVGYELLCALARRVPVTVAS